MTQTTSTLSGPVGTAERLDPALNTKATTLEAWFLHLPPAHPFWPRYILSVVHLRPEPGLGPAHLQYPEATHELMLAALDPDQHPEAQRPDTWRPLQPLNLVYQFHGLSDARAATLAAFAAARVVDGALWAEPGDVPGAREAWTAVLTAECRRLADRGEQ